MENNFEDVLACGSGVGHMFSTPSQISGLGRTEIVTLRHFPDDLALTAFKGRSFEVRLNHPSIPGTLLTCNNKPISFLTPIFLPFPNLFRRNVHKSETRHIHLRRFWPSSSVPSSEQAAAGCFMCLWPGSTSCLGKFQLGYLYFLWR